MAEIDRNERVGRTDWGAIWSGVFTFIAIRFIFGALGFAIFAASASPNAAHAATGMGIGIGIWVVILTIIAMYFAGREASHSTTVGNRSEGMRQGMIMFGLSVASVSGAHHNGWDRN